MVKEKPLDLQKLFEPKSIAIIGASNTPGKVGYSVVKNLSDSGYKGEVYPINLHESKIQGLIAYSSISKIGKTIDSAIICVPAKAVPAVIKDCAQNGIRAVIIITAGFSETGEAGKKLEDEIRKIVEENKMIVVGPNTLGVINTQNGFNASFAPTFPETGQIAIVSQSGALCTAILDWARQEKVGFSKFISTGNKTFLSEENYFNYLEEDKNTKAVLVYMESVKNAPNFLKAAAALSRKKPVVILKAGRSAEGQKAALSHTGAISGDDKIVSVALKKANAIRINSIEGFFDLAKLLSKLDGLKKFKLAVVTNAGGPGVIAADSAAAHNFILPQFSAKTIKAVKEINSHAQNPLDLIGDAKPIDYRTALKKIHDDKEIDIVYTLLTPQSMTNPERVADIIAALNKRKPILASFIGGKSVENAKKFLKSHGVVEFDTPERGIKALSRLEEYHKRKEIKKVFEQKLKPLKEIKKLLKLKKQLTLEESFILLKACGVSLPKTIFFSKKEELDFEKINYPVVLKTATGLAHKTEYGLIKVNIQTREELEKHITLMSEKLSEMKTKVRLAIQEMTSGQEVLVSSITNEFGKVITYGLGGIFVEVMQDVSQKISPLNDSDIEEMLLEVKGTKVLQGYRTKKKFDIEAIKKTLKALSQITQTYPQIKELEINPLIVNEEGAFAVDCVVVLE